MGYWEDMAQWADEVGTLSEAEYDRAFASFDALGELPTLRWWECSSATPAKDRLILRVCLDSPDDRVRDWAAAHPRGVVVVDSD